MFINACGRVDLPGGDINVMYQSLALLKALDDELTVWPGHDYGDTVCDTLGNQKLTNSYLSAVDKTTFVRKRS